ncbi:hypothetical protein LZ32DRAFT_326042 [Colletotrichum eremochloae]|nr:hypothetical protein LZ32DRAFT_326042 [Colletotrichum eremochloae]
MQHTDHASVNSFPSQKLQQRGTKGPSTYCRTTSYAPNPKCLLTHDTRAHTMSSTASHQKAAHCPSSVPSIARNTAKLRYSFLKGQKNTCHDANTRSLMQNTLHSQSSTLRVSGTQPTAFIVPQKAPLPLQRAVECSSLTEHSVCSITEGRSVVSRASENFTIFPFSKHQDDSLNKRHSIVATEYPITLPAIRNAPTSASKDHFTLPSLQNLLTHSSPPPTATPRLGKQSMSFIPELLVPPVTVPRPQSPSVPPWSLITVHQDPQCSDQASLTLPTPQHYFPTTSQNPQVTDEPSVSQRPKLMNKRPFRSSDSIIAAQGVLPLTSKRIRRSTSRAIASGKVVSPTPKRLSRSVSRRTGGQRQPLDCIQVVHHKEVSVPVPRRLRRSVVSYS